MRKWLKSLTTSPRGFSADGRRLGLGLAVAMEEQRRAKQRRVTAHEAQEFLREQPVAERAAA